MVHRDREAVAPAGRGASVTHPTGEDERLRALYEAVPCGIIVRGPSGRIVFVNSTAKRLMRVDLDPSEEHICCIRDDSAWKPKVWLARSDTVDLWRQGPREVMWK